MVLQVGFREHLGSFQWTRLTALVYWKGRPLYIWQLIVCIPMFLRGGLVFSGPCLGLWVVMWMWRRGFDPGLLWDAGRRPWPVGYGVCCWNHLVLVSKGKNGWHLLQGGRKGVSRNVLREREISLRQCFIFVFKKKVVILQSLTNCKILFSDLPFLPVPSSVLFRNFMNF